MSKIMKSTLRTEIIYDDSMKNKFVVIKEWNKAKRKALVIMKNAGSSNEVKLDQSSMYVINNLFDLDYGTVEIANLFSSVDSKETASMAKENLEQIKNASTRVDDVIIAVGKGIETNKKATDRLEEILSILTTKKENILEIQSPNGRRSFHPLHHSVKKGFSLVQLKSQQK